MTENRVLQHFLLRVVDHKGEVLEVLVSKTRYGEAARKFLQQDDTTQPARRAGQRGRRREQARPWFLCRYTVEWFPFPPLIAEPPHRQSRFIRPLHP